MSIETQYQKLHQDYRALAAKAAEGDKDAKRDKARVMNEIRATEQESTRNGRILSAQYRGDTVAVEVKETHTKRSLQEEYVRSFDNEKTVMIGGKEQTLHDYHSKRLLGR